MKHIPTILLLVSMLLTHSSCIDLEEDLSSLLSIQSLKSEAEVISVLASVYSGMADVYSAPHFQRVPTFGADDLTTWSAGNKAPFRVFDQFDYGSGENSDINWLDHGWDGYWDVIYRANSLIDGLKTAEVADEIVIIADAEARFLRALSYFHLVRTFGNMPVILDGYIPSGEEDRATVKDNYLHIEQDLLIAERNLPHPEEISDPGRVSSAAAGALLADLYLTWAGWPVKDQSKYPLAAASAKEVIDMKYFELLPIDELWLEENQNSRESLFSIQFSEALDLQSGYPEAFSFIEAAGWSDAFPELQFFYDFPEGARKDATFATEIPQRGVSDGTIYTKDPSTLPWEQSQRVHPMYKKFTISGHLDKETKVVGYRAVELYRYAEVLLIFAEAQAMIGENSSSIEALNQVKRRAAGLSWLTPDASVDVTTASVTEIIDEKGWELAGEYKRWFDMIRTERLEEITLKRDPEEQVDLLRQPDKSHYIAPIPFQTISSSKLVQNPKGFIIQ